MRVRSRSKNAALCAGALPSPLWASSARIHLDDHGVALAAARADRRAAQAAAAPAQLEHERAEDARARGADRMAERDGAAVDVDLVLVDPEHADRVQRDRSERLVDLPQVDVLGLQAGLLERDLGGVRRRAREVGEVVGDLRLGDDRGQRLLAVALGPLVAGQHERAAAVVDARRVAGRVGAVLHEDRRELGERLERGVAARRLVDLDHGVALLAT